MKKNLKSPTANHRQDHINVRDYGYDRSVHSLGRGEASRRRRRKQHTRFIILAAAVVLFALGAWLIRPLFAGQTPTGTTAQTTSEVTSSSTEAETTTSATSAAASETSATLSPAVRQARLAEAGEAATKLLTGLKGRFAVYYHNLANGETWQYNDDAPFVAASSIKLGINTYLYTKIASGEISPDEILTYDSRPYPTGDYEGGTGTVQGQPDGTAYSVRETSGLSIRISDNCATNMVIRRLGGIDAVNVYLSAISSIVDYRTRVSYTNYAGTAQEGRHRTSARDLGLHAVNLYDLWQENPAAYQPLIDDLCVTTFDFGIQKGIPGDIRVAHKIGTNGTYSAENDVGIVFAGQEPFVLCVMTEMASAQAAHQVQADIAGIFYGYVNGLQAD